MANFDVSFLNKKMRKSSGGDYGFLIDQLTIKENQLASDGKLSPGDYDLLKGEAQKLYGHPGFTKDQRSNLAVKISSYEKNKKTSNLQDSENLTRLDNETKDDNLKSSMILASKPEAFMKANIASTRAKINSLSDSINNLQAAGDDASAHMLKYQEALNDYNDLLQAADDMKNYAPGGQPTSAFAAYVTTNSKGEVTGIQVQKAGSRTGFAETNGLYGGLPVYGNAKVLNGKQTFKFGDQTFSATNILVPDPLNPGSFKNNKLVSEASQTSVGGGRTRATAGAYVEVLPDSIRSQSVVPVDSYVKGSKGFIYKAKSDGTYQKIVNSSAEKLGLDINDIPSIPKEYETNLVMPRISETIDASLPPETPLPSTLDAGSTNPQTTTSPTSPSSPNFIGPLPKGQSRTPAPTERAPQDAAGVADKTKKSAGFFSKLFGF